MAETFRSRLIRLFFRNTRNAWRQLCAFVDWLWPKRTDRVVFASVHGEAYAGNARAIFESFRNNHPELDCRFFFRDQTRVPAGFVGEVLPNWDGLRFLLSARTIFVTHGSDDFHPFAASRRKFIIQTWHGIPMRRIGRLDPSKSASFKRHNFADSNRFDMILMPSMESALRWCACTGASLERVFFCGQARNDFLLRSDLPTLQEPALAAIRDADRIILYAPTWRSGKETRWFPFDDFDRTDLEGVLERHNAVLLLRPHKTEAGRVSGLFSKRVRDFSSAVCPDVNVALPHVHVLITDYSSIFYDFLLLDRQILFFHYDYAEYAASCGFLFDNPETWFPGSRPETGSAFLAELDHALSGDDPHRDRRLMTNSLINAAQTSDSSALIHRALKARGVLS